MGRCFKPEARRHSADALAEMGEATLGFTNAKGAENHHRRNAGVRPTRLIVYCGDYCCAHSITMDPDLWPGNLRPSDLEDLFVCTVCGHRGADVRPAV